MNLIYIKAEQEYIQQLLFGGYEKYEQINKLAFMQKDRNNIDRMIKNLRTNSTFASSSTQADASACKRAIFCWIHKKLNYAYFESTNKKL